MKNKKSEITLVTLLALCWGFVFLDRVVIAYLFPILTAEFGFNNAQVGMINMFTSLGYIAFSVIFSILADRSGVRKKWLIPCILLASVISGSSAFAATITAFILIRFLTGASEGPVFPLTSSIVSLQGSPERFALNIGIISLVSTALTTVVGPILVTQIAVHLNWHYAFILTSFPTLILGLLAAIFIKEVDRDKVLEQSKGEKIRLGDFAKILKYRNIVLSIIIVCFIMVSLWAVAIYMPLYLVNVAKMTQEQMGFTMAAYGAVSLFWAILIPLVSNRLGRKTAAILFSLIATIPFIALYLSVGVVAKALFIIFAGILTFMPLLFFGVISTETVPPHFAATASALIMGIGELVGAAIAPRILGGIADGYGLPVVFLLGAISLIAAAIFGIGLVETNPKLIAKPTADAPVAIEQL